jgi:LemA protein
MHARKKILLIIAVPIFLLIVYVGWAYNKLIDKQERVDKAWGDVQNTYQRRADLVPSIVSVVKGLSDYESETMVSVVAARTKSAMAELSTVEPGDEGVREQAVMQDSLAVSFNRVLAVVERYPDLRGTTAYLNLQTQLEGTERRVKIARQDFNAAVAEYNKVVRKGSTGFVAKLFGFKVREPFQADPGADHSVEIKF